MQIKVTQSIIRRESKISLQKNQRLYPSGHSMGISTCRSELPIGIETQD